METEKRYEIIIASLSTLGLLAIAFCAFSPKVREEIYKRDKKICQTCGRKYSDGWLIHAAHNPGSHHHDGIFYDDPDSGACQCIECHTAQHEAGTSLGKHADAAAVRLLTYNAKRWK